MIQTILLVIAVLILTFSINNLINIHILNYDGKSSKELHIVNLLNIIAFSIGLSYIIWYCN